MCEATQGEGETFQNYHRPRTPPDMNKGYIQIVVNNNNNQHQAYAKQ